MLTKIPRKILFISILTCLAIGYASYYSYINIVRTSDSQKMVAIAKEALFRIDRVIPRLNDAEESAKQGILTGDEKYFREYDSTRKMLSARLTALRDFVKDNPLQEDNITNIEYHINREAKIVDSALVLRVSSPIKARKLIEAGEGRQNFEEVKNTVNSMKETENSILLSREDENNVSTYKSLRAILLSAVIALLLIIWLLYMLGLDIRKKEKAEKLAQENAKKYRDIFDQVGDVVYTSDYQGYFKLINSRITEVTGYAAGELIGKHFTSIVVPEMVEEIRNYYAVQFKNRIEETLKEFEILTKGGERKWIEQKVSMLLEGDTVNGFQGIVRDISKRKNMELALSQSNKKFENVFYSSPFAIIITNIETGKIFDINEEFTTMFGYTKEDVKGNSAVGIGLLTPEEREHIVSELRLHKTTKNIEFKFRKKSGELVTCLYSNILIEVEGVPSILALFTDITEIKRLEKAVAESNRKFLTIFSSSTQAVGVAQLMGVHKPGIIIEVNTAFCELFQVKKHEIIQHTMPEMGLISTGELERVFSEMQNKKTIINFEVEMSRKSGEKITCLVSFNDVELSGKLHRIFIYNDITDRKRLENELVLAKEKAEESTRIKESFLANVSHEIRTPMTGIIGLSDLLEQTKLTSEQKDYLTGIKHSSENLLSLVNEILDISKINAGKVVFEKVPFDFHGVVKNVVFTLSPRAAGKNIDLRCKIDASVPEMVVGDSVRLSQILWNLAGNAIKFTDKGFVEINVAKASEDNEKIKLRFVVKDTGIGIPIDRLENIFEEFTQADDSTSRIYGGTGLGLPIANKLVELQGGTISVESEEGAGSMFQFTIEYDKYLAQPKVINNNSEKELSEAKTDLTGLKILVAEDNKINQKICRKILTGSGATVEMADTGRKVIEKLESGNYDILLMDIQMPKMDGYQATQYIRSKMHPPKSTIPIIALTAFAMESETQRCFEAGMNDFTTKPYKAEELRAKILKFTKDKVD